MPGSLGLQLAEIHGVPRGLYDGPVHEVMVPAKPGGGSQARASCQGKISVPPVRNLHQSGFSLSGELSLLSVGEGHCPARGQGVEVLLEAPSGPVPALGCHSEPRVSVGCLASVGPECQVESSCSSPSSPATGCGVRHTRKGLQGPPSMLCDSLPEHWARVLPANQSQTPPSPALGCGSPAP